MSIFPPATRVRQACMRDLKAIERIEAELFEPHDAMDHDALMLFINTKDCRITVAERSGVLTGYLLFTVRSPEIEIMRIGVAPALRRKGFGSRMLADLRYYLEPIPGDPITLDSVKAFVHERNDAAVHFLAKNGFRAEKVIRTYFPQTDDDAYLMRYTPNYVKTRTQNVETVGFNSP